MGIFAKGFISGVITGITAVFTAAMVSVIHEDYVCRNTVFGSANLGSAEEKTESSEQENTASEVADAESEVADAGSEDNLKDA